MFSIFRTIFWKSRNFFFRFQIFTGACFSPDGFEFESPPAGADELLAGPGQRDAVVFASAVPSIVAPGRHEAATSILG